MREKKGKRRLYIPSHEAWFNILALLAPWVNFETSKQLATCIKPLRPDHITRTWLLRSGHLLLCLLVSRPLTVLSRRYKKSPAYSGLSSLSKFGISHKWQEIWISSMPKKSKCFLLKLFRIRQLKHFLSIASVYGMTRYDSCLKQRYLPKYQAEISQLLSHSSPLRLQLLAPRAHYNGLHTFSYRKCLIHLMKY